VAGADAVEGVSQDRFVEFVTELHKYMGDDKPTGETAEESIDLFRHIVGDTEALTKANLTELLHVTYKVVKPTMLTQGEAISSKTVRRLDENEYIKATDCPKKEAPGVKRVACKATKDDTEGWVTVSSNKGTMMLEPCSKYMACVKETVMTESLEVASDTVGKLGRDELVEVLHFPTKDPSSGVHRVQAKTMSSGTTGWVTVAANNGTQFLEQC